MRSRQVRWRNKTFWPQVRCGGWEAISCFTNRRKGLERIWLFFVVQNGVDGVFCIEWCLLNDKKVKMRLLALVTQVNRCCSPCLIVKSGFSRLVATSKVYENFHPISFCYCLPVKMWLASVRIWWLHPISSCVFYD